jgi:CheY-like chemotaxis protein
MKTALDKTLRRCRRCGLEQELIQMAIPTAIQIGKQSAEVSVLVLDDDEASQVVLRKHLNLLGFTQVQTVSDGLKGVAALDQMAQPPDIIICDIFMPEMDGIEFVAELLKRDFQGQLALITGTNTDILLVAQDIACMNGLHVSAVLTKPINAKSLGLAVARLQVA